MVRVPVFRPTVGLFPKCKSRSILQGDTDGNVDRCSFNVSVRNVLVFTLNNAGRRIESTSL